MKYLKYLKSHILFLLPFIIFLQCSYKNNGDPLKNIKLGQDSILSMAEFILDAQSFNNRLCGNYLINNNKYFIMISDIEGNQIACKINILLKSDSSYYNGRKKSGSGPIPVIEVDKLWNLYNQWYGRPDSLSVAVDTVRLRRPLFQFFNNSLDEPLYDGLLIEGYDIRKAYDHLPDIDTIIVDTTNVARCAIWKTKYYELTFTHPVKRKCAYDTTNLYYESAEIIYRMYNYSQINEQMQDSVRKNYKINDLIRTYFGNSLWYDNGWGSFMSLDRPANLDLHIIKSIRYQIVMYDAYEEELYRSESQTLDVVRDSRIIGTQPIGSGSSYLNYYIVVLPYDSKLLRIKEYARTNDVHYRTKITAIVFDDETILKK